MKRPTIGVTPDFDKGYRLNPDYVEAVRRAGARPLILPLASGGGKALDGIDGLLITGGNDINPRRWGERRHRKTTLLDPAHEGSNFRLLAEAERRDLPVLAICLGCQLVNVARGGSLIQHLADLSGVNAAHRKGSGTHGVTVQGRLAAILGVHRAKVNSSHHQAVCAVGRRLDVVARADDGQIEALEDPSRRFLVAVQWHPERMAGDAVQERLFAAFVAAART